MHTKLPRLTFRWVDEETETNTTARPAPDCPPGLEGGVTLTHPNTNTWGNYGGVYMITARLSFRGEMKSCTVFT